MKSQKIALLVASALFMLVALGHLVRLVMGWKIMVGTCSCGMWPSIVAVAVCAGLSAWMWAAATCKKDAAETPPQPKP